jgi:hypothetical protein
VTGAVLGALVRALVLVGVTLAWIEVVDRSESTDALGAGLVAFLVLLAISFAWSVVDGVRHGFARALLTWAVTAVLAAAGITVFVADSPAWDDVVFFGVLLAVPALVGGGIGAIVHQARGAAAPAE